MERFGGLRGDLIMSTHVEYVEPGEDGITPVTVRITKDEAIRIAKDIAKAHDHEYDNDQDALTDFLVVHWAEEA